MNLNSIDSGNLIINFDDGERIDGKINNISSLLKAISKIKIEYKIENDEVLFFRGHSDENWLAKPSIYRENNIKKEHIIFREIISSVPDEFNTSNNTFQKLVKMQHYGLPTRLLDITENPLIALYFTCKDNQEKDGEILVYRVPRDEIKYFDSDTVSILSNIAKMKSSFSIQDMDKDFLLHEIRQEKHGFLSNINIDDLSKVLFVKPILDNQRIIRQDGSFMLFGINKYKSEIAEIPEKYKVQKENKGFIIDKNDKIKILSQLELLGIHQAKLFPEIDNVTRHIKQRHLLH